LIPAHSYFFATSSRRGNAFLQKLIKKALAR